MVLASLYKLMGTGRITFYTAVLLMSMMSTFAFAHEDVIPTSTRDLAPEFILRLPAKLGFDEAQATKELHGLVDLYESLPELSYNAGALELKKLAKRAAEAYVAKDEALALRLLVRARLQSAKTIDTWLSERERTIRRGVALTSLIVLMPAVWEMLDGNKLPLNSVTSYIFVVGTSLIPPILLIGSGAYDWMLHLNESWDAYSLFKSFEYDFRDALVLLTGRHVEWRPLKLMRQLKEKLLPQKACELLLTNASR